MENLIAQLDEVLAAGARADEAMKLMAVLLVELEVGLRAELEL